MKGAPSEDLLAELERLQRRNQELEQQLGAERRAAVALEEARAELSRQRRFSEALLDAIPNPVFFKDRQGRYIGCNRAFSEQMGVTADELRGKTVFELWPTEHAERYHAKDLDLMAAPELQVYEWKVRDAHGTDRDVIFSKGVFVDERGEVAGLVGAYADITELKRAEEQLRHARRLESIGTLAGGVAHDFNNLLSPIIGHAELLQLEPGLEAAQEDLGLILQAARRAQQLTQQLLAFGRKQMLEMQVLDLEEVIEGFLPIARRLIREDITIELELAGAKTFVRGDRSQLEQVIANLLTNAQDAMPEGGVITISTALVTVTSETQGKLPAGRCVLLRVRDTGEGMDAKTVARIFEPFFTSKELGHGTGLGLATVYGVVKQHGGLVDVMTAPGRGATFEVRLPAVAGPSPVRPRSSAGVPLVGRKARILVVEDQRLVRHLAARALRRHGHEVLIAGGPEECFALMRRCEESETPVELLLTDVVMPRMDGPQLYRTLSARYPGLRVLYMTGYAEVELERRGGLDEDLVVTKPFSIRELAEQVQAALAGPAPGE